jgi:hypothetical protein
VRPYLENTHHKKKAGKVTQMVEYLLSKHEALSLSHQKKKKKKKKKKS